MIPSKPEPAPAGDAAPVHPLDWARQTSGRLDGVLRSLETKLKQRRQRRRKIGATLATFAVCVGLGLWGIPWLRFTGTLETAPAQRSQVTLADGSTAELSARTLLRTDFRGARRTVRLERGEAFFSVVKDPARPFLVETPAGTVRVTGTTFDVRLDRGAAVVTLIEGAVAVIRPGRERVDLRPDEQVDVAAPAGRPHRLTAAEIERVLSWRSGRMALDGLTLAEGAARFAAYHGRIIDVAPEAAGFALGGSCPLDDWSGFLAYLGEAFPVAVQQQADGAARVTAIRR